VLEVVAAARFGDLQALQQALQWSLEAKLEEPWARRLARHLGAELFRLEAAPKEPSGKRKREAKLDRSLPPGTRLLTASLLRGADPVAPAGLAVALAQGKGSVQLERWELICQAAQDNLELRGLEALPLRQDDGASPAQFGPPRAAFEDLWRQMAQAGAVELRRLCRQLGQFQKSLSAQLEEPEDESDAGERGLARCLGAYAAAARCAGLALVEG
ncbi:unnamed protein product, partial [Effrenium voratum]